MKYLLILLALISCSGLNEGVSVKGLKGEQLSIVFSHNINGETHPCGCRHFPLGGLPQVAGMLHKLRSENPVIYVDTGDTFFPSNNIPKNVERSLIHTANSIEEALNGLNLNFYLPGDQDFSAGINWLEEKNKKAKYHYLISNLKAKTPFKSKSWSHISVGPHQIYFLSVLDPQLLKFEHRKFFNPPVEAIATTLKTIKAKGYNSKDPFHRLILLSHSGIDTDKVYAQKYPEIDWIIGAHSQSFIKDPRKEGETKLVQVLSRNHYLGHIKISLKSDKDQDSYELLEMRDDKKDFLKPNKWLAFIDKHKDKLNKIQKEEHQQMTSYSSDEVLKFQSYNSCIECHQDQATKWQKTAHSLAFITLDKIKEGSNPNCIKCHTHGYKHESGFTKEEEMVEFSNEIKNPQEAYKEYIKEVKQAFSSIGSVRKLSSKEIYKHAKQQQRIDEKYKITHNYAHVQCLNCHDKHIEHPFAMGEKKLEGQNRYVVIKKRCLECHTPDQSTHWYKADEGGKKHTLDEKLFNTQYRAIACPTASQ